MDWEKISTKLLIPFAIVFLLCLFAIKSLGQALECECFVSKFGMLTVFVVGVLSLVSSVPIVWAVKKDWKSTYTLFIIFIFVTMIVVSLLIGEIFSTT